MRINGIPNCDTVKKARKWLEAQGLDHTFRNFKTDPPTADEVGRWADDAGWQVLLNRRGTTFRKLDEGDKADLTRESAIALMLQHPSLIKRPVLEPADSDRVIVGFAATEWENALC
ncbi:arsenate reductase [Alteriqipengyuania lutimaris]|uniref:Arsenate reductase n=1 Tax=Alteriqipengyuania lutimaris TaxID=1538146 RepID=A0A395LIK2_9SPHN|nr:arsenate reductase [Alteriqipengyuania lutimaris]MBB3034658.1 Spx/MgsR family transcriptional regulator [Alteriqipengyuania lutimaris]RDS76479.1 arsenate reductase [Alteriqipengyuania lutimaris]